MKDLEDALQRLDNLTREEALLVAAEDLTITREIGDKVEDVDDKIGSVNEGERLGERYYLMMRRNFSSLF